MNIAGGLTYGSYFSMARAGPFLIQFDTIVRPKQTTSRRSSSTNVNKSIFP
jgi:hypothetical protein